MLNATSFRPTSTPSFEVGFINASKAEITTRSIINAIKFNSRTYDIATRNHSTAGLFIISTPEYFFRKEESVPRVSSVAQNSTFPWVDRIVEFAGKSMEDAALKEIAEITTKLKASHGESQISAGFSQLSKHKIPDIIAIALLRNTFSFRSKVSCWDDFLAATEDALSAKGKDPKRLLRGLKK